MYKGSFCNSLKTQEVFLQSGLSFYILTLGIIFIGQGLRHQTGQQPSWVAPIIPRRDNGSAREREKELELIECLNTDCDLASIVSKFIVLSYHDISSFLTHYRKHWTIYQLSLQYIEFDSNGCPPVYWIRIEIGINKPTNITAEKHERKDN